LYTKKRAGYKKRFVPVVIRAYGTLFLSVNVLDIKKFSVFII
jgi:hypothetical protein